jgi:CheY-like chemotaxis protein
VAKSFPKEHSIKVLTFFLNQDLYSAPVSDISEVNRMAGIQVLRQLKADEHMRLIPVVVLTSSRESLDLEDCYRLGVNAYVVKPVRFLEFVEAVKQIVVFWTLINEAPPGSVKR